MTITEKQLAARASGIGASEVGTVLGVNSRKSAYTLWMEKTGKIEPEDLADNRAVQLGNLMEPVLLEYAADELGRKVVRPTGTYRALNGIMFANLDGQVGAAKRGSEAVEAKSNWMGGDQWGAAGTDDVPPMVLSQCAAQMICSDAPCVHVARCVGRFGLVFSLYHIERLDEAMLQEIQDRVCDFWTKHVLKDIPPDDSAPELSAMTRIDRKPITASIPTDVLKTYMDAKETLKAAEKAEEDAKAMLLAAMQTNGVAAEVGVCDIGKATYRPFNRTGFNASAFAAEHPDLHEKYLKTTTYRRLSITTNAKE